MKKWFFRSVALWLFLCLAATPVFAYELIPGGQVVGLEVKNGTLTVIGFSENSPARAAGVEEGDVLWAVDGRQVTTVEELHQTLGKGQDPVSLTLRRKNKEQTLSVQPNQTPEGAKLGLYLKEGITGIGTVTYYDPATGTFGALGHGVNTPDGHLSTLTGGTLSKARVTSVRKGKAGDPGQLVGTLADPEPCGNLTKNTARGLFGTTQSTGQTPLSTAHAEDVKPGKATILSTVSGTQPQEYSVQILRIYPNSQSRNLVLRVTDPALLAATGGIVQGMSGSPIIQDGKLVGAVTHVLVNDPTTGYGIFIENMLEAAA